MDIGQIKETKASREFRLFFERQGLDKGKAEGKAEGLVEGKAEGLVVGKRDALVSVLAARGLTPTEAERARIAGLEDTDELEACIQRAVTAKTVAAALLSAPRRTPARTSGGRRGRRSK
ncbi:MAG: hypothetical protein R3F14_33260 [Polyangiaceae bacterium]